MRIAETHVSVHSSHHTPPEPCSGGSFLKAFSSAIVTIYVDVFEKSNCPAMVESCEIRIGKDFEHVCSRTSYGRNF